MSSSAITINPEALLTGTAFIVTYLLDACSDHHRDSSVVDRKLAASALRVQINRRLFAAPL